MAVMLGLALSATQSPTRRPSRSGGATGSEPAQPVQPGLIGWYDAAAPETLTLGADNQVLGMANRVAAGADLLARPEGGPTYQPASALAGGRPAVQWPNAENARGLWLDADVTVRDVFLVLAYADGLSPAFADYNTLFTDTAGLTGTSSNRIMGFGGADHLHTATLPAGSSLRLNGSASTPDAALLPLPLSILHVKNDSGFPLRAIGARNNNLPRSWRGVMCEVLTYATALSTAGIGETERYLQHKWGLT